MQLTSGVTLPAALDWQSQDEWGFSIFTPVRVRRLCRPSAPNPSPSIFCYPCSPPPPPPPSNLQSLFVLLHLPTREFAALLLPWPLPCLGLGHQVDFESAATSSLACFKAAGCAICASAAHSVLLQRPVEACVRCRGGKLVGAVAASVRPVPDSSTTNCHACILMQISEWLMSSDSWAVTGLCLTLFCSTGECDSNQQAC